MQIDVRIGAREWAVGRVIYYVDVGVFFLVFFFVYSLLKCSLNKYLLLTCLDYGEIYTHRFPSTPPWPVPKR